MTSFWKTQHVGSAYFYHLSSIRSFICFSVTMCLITHKQQTRYLANVCCSLKQFFSPETHHTRNADNRLIFLHPGKEISKMSVTERKRELKKRLARMLTLRLVLSLPPDDTLHLFPGLLSTGGDSLSFSACCNFLFRSWNMSWWRFLVCMIFCARINRIMQISSCTQFSHEHVFLFTRLQMNAAGTSKSNSAYRDFRLCNE